MTNANPDHQHLFWDHPRDQEAHSYICAFCGDKVASALGYAGLHRAHGESYHWATILICPGCSEPTYFTVDHKSQYPAPPYGAEVLYLPGEVFGHYAEVRSAYSAGAFTASAMAGRKVLMNVSVALGADQNQNFLAYVDYLVDNHHVTAGAKGWVDKIRSKGNEANHEIALTSQVDAKDLIDFVEMLLKLVYEYPKRAKR